MYWCDYMRRLSDGFDDTDEFTLEDLWIFSIGINLKYSFKLEEKKEKVKSFWAN